MTAYGVASSVSINNPLLSGALLVTGTVTLNNGGGASSNLATTGSAGIAVGNAPYAPLWISVTSSLPVTFGSLPQLAISNFPATQAISGGVVVQNWPAVHGVSASFPLQVWSEGSIGVSGTVTVGNQISVNNFPATQAVSGTVTSIVGNWPATLGVSASVPLQIWSAGTIGVSGTITVSPAVTQTAQNVSSSSGLRVWNDSAVGVSGTVGVNNFPATQNVSGGIVVQNWPATIGVSSSFPLNVFNAGTVGVSGTVSLGSQISVNNFPATQAVSGGIVVQNWPATLGVTASAALPIWTTGPVGITASVNLHVWDGGVQGITGSVNAYTSGPQAVSGTVGVNNFPAVQAVSGSQLTGSTFAGSPVVVGGTWLASGGGPAYVTALRTDISGVLFVSASNPTLVWNQSPVGVSGSVNVYTSGLQGVSGTVGVNNFPATQNVSGTVTSIIGNWPATLGVSASFPLQTWAAAPTGVTGSANVYTSGPQAVSGTVQIWSNGPLPISGVGGQIGVSNFPATQNVSGSITVGTWGTNVTASIQGSALGIPIQIWSAGQIGVSGSLSTTPGITQTAQNVSSSSGVRVWNDSAVGVSGVLGGIPVQIWSAQTIGVSGTFTAAPAVTQTAQSISGSQLTGSTFSGLPVVGGGVWFASGGGPAYVKSLQTDISGALYVTTSGTLPVSIVGTLTTAPGVTQTAQNVSSSNGLRVWNDVAVGVTGSVNVYTSGLQGISGGIVVQNWPATLGVSSSVALRVWDGGIQGISASATLPVFNAGTVGVSGSVNVYTSGLQGVSGTVGINNFPATQAISGGVVVQNWPATLGVSASFPLQIWSAGTVGVSGSVNVYTSGLQGISGTISVNNFPAVQAISGSQITGSTFGGAPVVMGGVWYASGGGPAYVKGLQTDISGVLLVSASNPVLVWNAGTVGVSGTVTLGSQVSVNNFPATQAVSGGIVVQNWPLVAGVTGSVNAYTSGPQAISGTVQIWSNGPLPISGAGGQIGVSNFPATQNVSGSITIGTWGTNVTASVQGSALGIPLQIWSAGTIGVSGSLSTTPGITQTAQNVSSSSGVRVWNDVAVGVTGSVNVYTSGPQMVSGTVGVNNFPAIQAVSGGIVVQNWPLVHGITGSVNVYTSGLQGISGGVVIQNWPSAFGVSASIPLQVWSEGNVGVSGTVTLGSQVSVNNFPATQAVSGTVTSIIGNWPATLGVSASIPLQIWSAGTIGVSGTLSTTPGITQTAQSVSGSQLTGSTFSGLPLVGGGVWYASSSGPAYVKALQTDISGVLLVSASNPVLVWNQTPVGVTGSVNVYTSGLQGISGTVGVNNFPATQNVSGGIVVQNWPATIGVSASVALRVWDGGIQGITASTSLPVWNQSPVGVTGSVNVYTSGLQGISGTVGVNNFPATQNVSGTVTSIIGNWPATIGVSASFPLSVFSAGTVGVSGSVNVTTTGSAGMQVGNAPYAPLWITSTGSISVGPSSGQVFPQVITTVSGWATSSQIYGTVFPAGFTRTSDEPTQLFYDPFDGVTVDANNWQNSVASGGGVVTAVTGGNMTIGTGTSTGGYAYIQSVNYFRLPIPGWMGLSQAIMTEAAPIANTYRFWGQGTVPGTPTASSKSSQGTSLVNGVGWELGTDGKLLAVVWANGVRTIIQDFSSTGTNKQPLDGLPHRYICYIRTDKIFWYIDGLDIPVATSNFVSPMTQTLPNLFLAVAGTSPGQSAVITCLGIANWDTAKNGYAISDGTYGWRKSKLDPSGSLYVTTSGSIPVIAAVPLQIWSAGTIGVSGSLSTTPGITQTAQNVSSSAGLRVWNDVAVGVTGSVSVYTSGIQAVSGVLNAVPIEVFDAQTNGVTGSVNVYTSGPQAVSGTVQIWSNGALPVSGGIVVQNWPATIGVSASIPLRVWDGGVQGVSASFPLQIWSAGTIGVSGSVTTSPAVTQTPTSVTGSQLTGSTFGGSPVVIGGVWIASASGGPAYVTALQTSISGVLLVSASNPVLVWNQTAVGVTGSANVYTSGPQSVTGSVSVYTSGPQFVSGVIGVNNFPATQAISGGIVVQNWPATIGVSASVALRVWDGGIQGVTASATLPVFNQGTIGVSGTLGINNFPGTQNVSGTVNVTVSGSTGLSVAPFGQALSASFPTSAANLGYITNKADLFGRPLIAHIDGTQHITKAFNATTTQTGGLIWQPASGKRIAVTSLVVSSFGTTSARVILWFATSANTTYGTGETRPLAIASFAPSSTAKPGLVMTPFNPIYCPIPDYQLKITTDAAISIDVVVHGYEY